MKRLMALLAALTIAAAMPATAQAAVREHTNHSCTETWHNLGDPVPFVCLAVNTAFGGDKLSLTGSSDIANLGNQLHTLAGNCNGGLIGTDDDWNDCISSVWVKLGTGDSVCVYRQSSFHSLLWRAGRPPGPGTWTYSDSNLQENFPATDVVSSVMLQQSGDLCGEGGV